MKLQFTSNICTHYVTALEYYDISALDDNEIALVDKFVASMPANCVYSWPIDDDTHFGRDDITGLMADCVTVEVWSD